MHADRSQEPKDSREIHRYVFLGGLAFGVGMGAFFRVMTGSWYYGFHGGFFCGFAFGWLLRRVLKVSTSAPKLGVEPDASFDPGESVVHWGPANHFKGIEAVGGKLFLTNRRLRFRSHRFNVQTHDESYPIEAIASVEPARTLGVIPNAIRLRLADGRRERFVVMAREHWIATLRQVLASRVRQDPGSG